MNIVGTKALNHIMGLGPHLGRLAMFEERKWMPKGFPTQVSWIGGHLKDGSRRNASSDVMSMAQTCTLSARRTPPTDISSRDASHRPTGKKDKISKEMLLLPH